MKMNALVLCLIWGSQWGCTKLESGPDQLTGNALHGQPIPWLLSTPVSGCGQKALGQPWRCVGWVNPRLCILLSVCQLSAWTQTDSLGLCLNIQTIWMQSLLNLRWVINCVVASEVQCFYAVLSFALCCCTALFPFNFKYFSGTSFVREETKWPQWL